MRPFAELVAARRVSDMPVDRQNSKNKSPSFAEDKDEEEDFNFAERFSALKAEFEAQLQEEAALNKAIAESLARVKL